MNRSEHRVRVQARPPPVFALMCAPSEFQNDGEANEEPSRSDRGCKAGVKNDSEFISSQTSNL